MKGVDISQAEIECARRFIMLIKAELHLSTTGIICTNFNELLRVIAWYGLLRREAEGEPEEIDWADVAGGDG